MYEIKKIFLIKWDNDDVEDERNKFLDLSQLISKKFHES